MVGVQEAIPFRESASALLGGGKAFVPTEVEQSEFGHRRISFPAKAIVFTEGEPVVAVHKLTYGVAGLYKMMDDGRRQIVRFALPGDFLASPFSDRHPCSVDAISQVTARQFSRRPFLTSLQANPKGMNLMLEASMREIDAARDHMLILGRGTAEEKFVEFIINWRARLGRKGALASLVPLPMSRRDIADYLGLTIETVSRVLAKLAQEKILRVIPEGLQLMGPTERLLLLERSYKSPS
jgi:CRP/FNR family transcriptional regulator